MRALLAVAIVLHVLLLLLAVVDLGVLSDIWKDYASPRLMQQYEIYRLPWWTRCEGEWGWVYPSLLGRAGVLLFDVVLLSAALWKLRARAA